MTTDRMQPTSKYARSIDSIGHFANVFGPKARVPISRHSMKNIFVDLEWCVYDIVCETEKKNEI